MFRKIATRARKGFVNNFLNRSSFYNELPVRIYGTASEFETAGKIYVTNQSDVTLPVGRELYTWSDSARLRNKILKDDFNLKIPGQYLTISSLRALGAGIQNTCDLPQLIKFVREELNNKGVEIITTFILAENEENYVQGMKNTILGKPDPQVYGKSKKHNFDLPNKVLFRGKVQNINMQHPDCTVVNGIRLSSEYHPANDSGPAVHFFGASEIFGTHLRNQDTIPSQMARIYGSKFRVFNHGMGGVNFIDVLNKVLKTSYYPGDKVILSLPYHQNLKCVDLLVECSFDEMFDYSHPNEKGNARAADKICDFLMNKNRRESETDVIDILISQKALKFYEKCLMEIEVNENEKGNLSEDLAYFLSAKTKIDKRNRKSFGSVAVNCNPITRGHEHLIDFARSQVDFLFVLVIEEDSSAVSFEDRLNLVKLVCADKENVMVLRGGRYVCTEYIAPEYFVKSNAQTVQMDFGLESFYFGNYIAPALDITKVFLGDEPKCALTKRYNDHMAEALPNYGIELTIIPRILTADGDVISASKVRELLLKKDGNALSKYVPDSTIPYLLSDTFELRIVD